ncbi:hypothetical protein ACRAWD_27115 [Caulobacter segnis]
MRPASDRWKPILEDAEGRRQHRVRDRLCSPGALNPAPPRLCCGGPARLPGRRRQDHGRRRHALLGRQVAGRGPGSQRRSGGRRPLGRAVPEHLGDGRRRRDVRQRPGAPTPSPSAGFYISDTKTPGHIYEVSVEHHVRNEFVLDNVENWEFLAPQTEQEVGATAPTRFRWRCATRRTSCSPTITAIGLRGRTIRPRRR